MNNKATVLKSRGVLGGISSSLVAGLLLACPVSAWPQSITATVNVSGGGGLAINTMTDKIYVSGSPVNIIDGKTKASRTFRSMDSRTFRSMDHRSRSTRSRTGSMY